MLIRQFGQARLSHEIMNSIVYFLCLCCDCDSTLHIVSKQIFKLNIRHFSRFFFFFFFNIFLPIFTLAMWFSLWDLSSLTRDQTHASC